MSNVFTVNSVVGGASIQMGGTGTVSIVSGSNSITQVSGISSIVVTGLSISGTVGMAGIGGTQVSISGNSVLISGGSTINTGSLASTDNLNATGSFLQGQISAINNGTGLFITDTQVGLAYATKINLANTGATLQNEINTINASTGIFATTEWTDTNYLCQSGFNTFSGNLVLTNYYYSPNLLASNIAGSIVSGLPKANLYSEVGIHGITVIPYVTMFGRKLYSPNNTQYEFTPNFLTGTTTGYRINWNWTSAPGASGYLILKRDDIYGYNYNASYHTSNINFIDYNPTNPWSASVPYVTGSPNVLPALILSSGTLSSVNMTGAIEFSSAGFSVTDINGVRGVILTGNSAADYATVNNLSLTGTTLQNQISAINNSTGIFISSGQTGQFAANIHTHSQYVQTGNTGSFITTSQTGAFYATSNPAGYITAGQVAGAVSTIGGLSGVVGITGAGNVTTSITSPNTITISGNTGNFVTTSQTGAFITTGQTGVFSNADTLDGQHGSYYINTGQTGSFVGANQTGNFVTTSQTGLFAPITSPTFLGTVTLPTNTTLPDSGQILLTAPTANGTAVGFTTNAFPSFYTSSAVGDLVFLNSSAKWQKVSANTGDTCKGLMGVALTVVNSGTTLLTALPGSFVRVDAWNWNVGDTLFAGETSGTMQNVLPSGANNVVRVMGFAVNADYIYFFPSSDQSTTVA